jgi:hypothetical protein
MQEKRTGPMLSNLPIAEADSTAFLAWIFVNFSRAVAGTTTYLTESPW